MRLVVVFVVLIALVSTPFLAGVLAAHLTRKRRRNLIAGAPPGALVEPTDSATVAVYKRRIYAQQRKQIRLLEEVRRVDETMTFLPADLRKEIDEAVEEFYGED